MIFLSVYSQGENLVIIDKNVEGATIDLVGEAIYYWGERITSLEQVSGFSGQSGTVRFPGFWAVQEDDFLRQNPKGLATFHLSLKLPDSSSQYALKLISMVAAYEVWVDGEEISSIGTVSDNVDEMIPDFQPNTVLLPRKKQMDIFFVISNFHHRKGGGSWEPILIGLEDSIQEKAKTGYTYELFAASMMLFIALYHMLMFAFYPDEKAYLYFALAVFMVSTRIITSGEMVIEELIPDFPYAINQSFRYVGYMLPTGFLVLYVAYFLEIERKSLAFIFFGITAVVCLLAFVLPTYSSTLLTPVYHGLTFCNLTLSIRMIMMSRERFPVISMFMLGVCGTMFLVLIHAVLIAFDVIGGTFFYEEGFLILMLGQVLIMAYRHKQIQEEKLKLQVNLKHKEGDLATVISDNRMRLQFRKNMLAELSNVASSKNENLRTRLNSLISSLNLQINTEEKYDFLQSNIESINADFESRLKTKFPQLSQSEVELCFLIRLNLPSKEIAGIRQTSEGAIKVAKHRIRKKLDTKEVSLEELFESL